MFPLGEQRRGRARGGHSGRERLPRAGDRAVPEAASAHPQPQLRVVATRGLRASGRGDPLTKTLLSGCRAIGPGFCDLLVVMSD